MNSMCEINMFKKDCHGPILRISKTSTSMMMGIQGEAMGMIGIQKKDMHLQYNAISRADSIRTHVQTPFPGLDN